MKIDSSELLKNLEKMENKSEFAIRMYAQEGAKKFENYAKKNRPWVDRTGHARQRLLGWVERTSNFVRIYIGHGVEYGIHLELGHEKKYSILQPTINKVSEEVLEGFKNLLRYIKP